MRKVEEQRDSETEHRRENARRRIKGCLHMQDIIWNEINPYMRLKPKAETESDYIRIYQELNEIIAKEATILSTKERKAND